MAQNPEPRLVELVTSPQHFTPPTARELRAQSVHRLQIGLLGLATMLLLVAMANVINDRVRLNEAEAGIAPAEVRAGSGPGVTDPLADIGVVPAADPHASDPAPAELP
ncbi:MAG: hypothetical protein WCY11_17290 [Novosphingobium sp.]